MRPTPHTSNPALPREASTILVPLDGSVEATEAMPVAHSLAQLTNAAVHVLHVAAHPLPPDTACDKLRLTAQDRSHVVLDQRRGAPAPAIVREAKKRHCRVIVMCPHGEAGRHPLGFQSTAARILAHTTCPIVFVPPGRGRQPWTLRRLLAPLDGSPSSMIPIGAVGDLCGRTPGDMTILHVSTVAANPSEERGAFAAPHYLDQPQHEWPEWGTEFLDRIRATAKPPYELTLRTILGTDDIGRTIVRYASEQAIDLILLGWRRHVQPHRSQVLRAVVAEATCPVLVYPIATKRAA